MKKHTNFEVEAYEKKGDKVLAVVFALIIFGAFVVAVIEYTGILKAVIY